MQESTAMNTSSVEGLRTDPSHLLYDVLLQCPFYCKLYRTNTHVSCELTLATFDSADSLLNMYKV